MRILKILPVAVAFLGLCKSTSSSIIDNGNNTNIDLDQVSEGNQNQLENQLGINKRTYIPKLSNIYCGDNTKTCNIGFETLYVQLYGFRWEMITPRATIIETFRKEKKEQDEYISMVTTIRNYNIYYPVYITGTVSYNGCFNDKNNQCTLDKFLDQPLRSGIDASLVIRNIEDKSIKRGRFKYSDWTGKCYKIWDITFDIQATKEDLEKWLYFKSINVADFD